MTRGSKRACVSLLSQLRCCRTHIAFVFMKLETHGTKVFLATDEGLLHVPGTLYLNEKYWNPHTKQVAARALRVWVRFATAFDIDLAARTLEGRWLTEVEMKALRYLVFRPIYEIESMPDLAVRRIASATKRDEPNLAKGAVEPNTAVKQLVGIADFLTWFHRKVLEPRMPVGSSVAAALRQQVENAAHEMKRAVGGTKAAHPHRIRSVPTQRFLQIYSAVFLRWQEIFRTAAGRSSGNAARDRAIVLLAGEGVRPGAIGNIALADFRWQGGLYPAYLRLVDNTGRRAEKVNTRTPVQKGAASLQNYNSEITVPIWPTTAHAIQQYIDGEREVVVTQGLRNRSKGFLFLADHGGPIGDRGTIARVFRRAGKSLSKIGLLSKDPADPYLDGESYDFDAYLLRHSAASLFYATKALAMNPDVVIDLMKMRFGWSTASGMPALYAQRAISNAASLTVDEYMESLFAEARLSQHSNGQGNGRG